MLELKDITVKFDDFGLKNVNLNIKQGEYFVLLGLSGAGKSVLLECIAGLNKPVWGKVLLEGKNITNDRIQDREVGLVFQDHAVFPHMSAFDNIAYPLIKQYSKKEIHTKVEELASLMNIKHLLHRSPTTLSGGELQRVAFARTLARNPKCLLLDEPLSSLDVQLKDELRALLRKLNRMGQTIVHVTHDYEEAIALAHKIAIVQNGEIIQSGTPMEVFSNPVSDFVAKFGGIKNFFEVKMIDIDHVETKNGTRIQIRPQHQMGSGYIMFSSEEVILSKQKNESSITNQFQGTVIDIIPSFEGAEIRIQEGITLSAFITHQSLEKLSFTIGDKIWANFKASIVKFLPAS
ncbi:MAG: ABC transporter ATP-binding protein [Bacteroidales bacterium]|nr:ABC transporter ATP-binding protein [Bacteroidales bacterium]